MFVVSSFCLSKRIRQTIIEKQTKINHKSQTNLLKNDQHLQSIYPSAKILPKMMPKWIAIIVSSLISDLNFDFDFDFDCRL